MKDWTGNKATTFVTLGASNHVAEERQSHDYYATDPKALEKLLEVEKFDKYVWECACGEGHLVRVLETNGYEVEASDIVKRGYNCKIIDFLQYRFNYGGDIITNPPYKYAQEFVEKAIDVVEYGHKVAMFLKVQFLEGQKRRKMFEKFPPKVVYVFSERMKCAKNGDFENTGSSAVAYAWYIWEKGFTGEPVIRWL